MKSHRPICKKYLHIGGKYMYINQIYELSMVLDNEKFRKILNYAHKKADYLEEDDGEYVDQSMADKGITVTYRDSQYKKKVKMIINAGRVMGYDKTESDKFLRRLDKRLGEYFDHKYNIDDFSLSGTAFITDIDVGSRESVSAYLRVLRRTGKVKGFKPVDYGCFEDIDSLCWEGISSGIAFSLYDLEDMCRNQFDKKEFSTKKYREIIKETEGLLRAEVRLMKPKAIRVYTDRVEVGEQIADLMKNHKDVFLDTFAKIVPFGDFYKKDKAVEIICREIRDGRLRRRMLRLVTLIPEKKSLFLAQKAMEYRNMEKIMRAFTKINVSPVTISKRQDMKRLENVYEHLLD
jgi:hypothetical protein